MEQKSRNRKTLIIFGIALVIFAYIYTIFIPQFQVIDNLNTQIEDSKSKYQLYSGYKKRIDTNTKENSILVENMNNLRSSFPPNIRQNDIYVLFSYLSNVSGVSFTNISISEAKEISIVQNTTKSIAITDPNIKKLAVKLGLSVNVPTKLEQPVKGVSNIVDGRGYVIEVRVDSTGTDRQYKNLFSELYSIPSQINLKQYNATANKDGLLNANFTVAFFGIKDQNANFEGFLMQDLWQPSTTTGKENIFAPFANLAQPVAPTAKVIQTKNNALPLSSYDFTMRVVPYGNNMAPSTVSLSARNLINNNKPSSVSSDNDGEETVHLFISETNGKYFCKYKTQKEVFPTSDYSQLAEFKPAATDKIMLGIDSKKRIFSNDKSSVNLKVYNNTSKPFNIDVLNDDASYPRVRIEKNVGNINIAYK